MENIKISVIIPVYNVEKYLVECLDSVINQTFTDIEIICVNDGSTDNSLVILENYANKDSRIKIISQENKGVSCARNTGIAFSNGKYIYFIDSDDYLELDALNKLYNLAEDNSLDLIMFKLLNFNDEDGKKYNQYYYDMPYLKHLVGDIFDYNDMKDDIFSLNVTVYTKFFKRELISESEFLEGCIFEDTLFLVDYIFDAKRIMFLDEYLYFRRIRQGSIIFSASKQHVDIIRIYNNILEKIKALNIYEYYKHDLFNRKFSGIYNRYSKVKSEYKEYFFNKFKEDALKYRSEYELELDFNKVNQRSKFIFENILKSDTYREFDLSVENYEIKQELNNLKNIKHNLEDNIKRLNEKNTNLTNDLNSIKKDKKLKKLNKVKDENKQIKKELKSANKLNESILNSKSWKITKPLRKLRNLK